MDEVEHFESCTSLLDTFSVDQEETDDSPGVELASDSPPLQELSLLQEPPLAQESPENIVPCEVIQTLALETAFIQSRSQDSHALQQSFLDEFAALKQGATKFHARILEVEGGFEVRLRDVETALVVKSQECELMLTEADAEIALHDAAIVELNEKLASSELLAETNTVMHQANVDAITATTADDKLLYDAALLEKDALIAKGVEELNDARSTINLLEANTAASAVYQASMISTHISETETLQAEMTAAKCQLEANISAAAALETKLANQIVDHACLCAAHETNLTRLESLEAALLESTVSAQTLADSHTADLAKLQHHKVLSSKTIEKLQTSLAASETSLSTCTKNLESLQKSSTKTAASQAKKIGQFDTMLSTLKSNHSLEVHGLKEGYFLSKIEGESVLAKVQERLESSVHESGVLQEKISGLEDEAVKASAVCDELRVQVERLAEDAVTITIANEDAINLKDTAMNAVMLENVTSCRERDDLSQRLERLVSAHQDQTTKYAEHITTLQVAMEASVTDVARLEGVIVERDAARVLIDAAQILSDERMALVLTKSLEQEVCVAEEQARNVVMQESNSLLKLEIDSQIARMLTLSESVVSAQSKSAELKAEISCQTALHKAAIEEMDERITASSCIIQRVADLFCTEVNGLVEIIESNLSARAANVVDLTHQLEASVIDRNDTTQLLANIDILSHAYEADTLVLSRLLGSDSPTNDLHVLAERLTTVLDTMHSSLQDQLSDSVRSDASAVISVPLIVELMGRLDEKRRGKVSAKYDSAVDVDGHHHSQETVEVIESLIRKLHLLLNAPQPSVEGSPEQDLLRTVISTIIFEDKQENKTLHASNVLLRQGIKALRREIKTLSTEFALHLNRTLLQSAQLDKIVLNNDALTQSIEQKNACVVMLVEKLAIVQSGYEKQSYSSTALNKTLKNDLGVAQALNMRAEGRMEILLSEFRRQDDVIKSLKQLVKSGRT